MGITVSSINIHQCIQCHTVISIATPSVLKHTHQPFQCQDCPLQAHLCVLATVKQAKHSSTISCHSRRNYLAHQRKCRQTIPHNHFEMKAGRHAVTRMPLLKSRKVSKIYLLNNILTQYRYHNNNRYYINYLFQDYFKEFYLLPKFLLLRMQCISNI